MNLFTRDYEQQLTQRLHDGDHAAMREFYNLLGGQMMAVVLRYVGNEEDAKDVLQETLVKVFSRICDFHYRGPGSLKAWAMRLAINQSLTFLRERKRDSCLDLKGELPDLPEETEPDTGDVPPEALQAMIQALPDGYRAVFNLYVFEQLSHDEIARQLGIKRDSSASQLHRAKALLARKITEYRRQKQTEQ